METIQKNLIFDKVLNNRSINEKFEDQDDIPKAQVTLDTEICRALANYLKRYSSDESLIEVKGKLIKYIRGI